MRLQLQKEDSTPQGNEKNDGSEPILTPSAFIIAGLEIEESQYVASTSVEPHEAKSSGRRVLAAEKQASHADKTSKQEAELLEKNTSLYRRILVWRKSQLAHQPNLVAVLPTVMDDEDFASAETVALHLPHSLTSSATHKIRVQPKLTDIERRLREAQADDALFEIRRLRRIITGLWQFKHLQLSGEGNKPNTRLRGTHSRLQLRINRAVARYRAARNALVILDPNGGWRTRLLMLEDRHIKGPGPEDGESSTHYDMSWIWSAPRPAQESTNDVLGAADLAEGMRVEWAKARARKLRWDEELQLLQEEMRRTVVYLRWKADWWRTQENRRETNAKAAVAAGAAAYAQKQGAMLDRLAESTAAMWMPVLRDLDLPVPREWGRTAVTLKGGSKEEEKGREFGENDSEGKMAGGDNEDTVWEDEVDEEGEDARDEGGEEGEEGQDEGDEEEGEEGWDEGDEEDGEEGWDEGDEEEGEEGWDEGEYWNEWEADEDEGSDVSAEAEDNELEDFEFDT